MTHDPTTRDPAATSLLKIAAYAESGNLTPPLCAEVMADCINFLRDAAPALLARIAELEELRELFSWLTDNLAAHGARTGESNAHD